MELTHSHVLVHLDTLECSVKLTLMSVPQAPASMEQLVLYVCSLNLPTAQVEQCIFLRTLLMVTSAHVWLATLARDAVLTLMSALVHHVFMGTVLYVITALPTSIQFLCILAGPCQRLQLLL